MLRLITCVLLVFIAQKFVLAQSSIDDNNRQQLEKKTVFSLEEALKRKKNVKSLFLSGEDIREFPEEILLLKRLRILALVGTQISEIPDLSTLCDLEVLNLSRNRNLSTDGLFRSLESNSKLKELDLTKSGLSDLAGPIERLKNLEVLQLYRNSLDSIPSRLTDLRNLKTLLLEGNNISGLPDSFDKLENLQVLTLNDNEFKVIPSVVSNLPNLKYVYCGNEGLKSNQVINQLASNENLELIHFSNMRFDLDSNFELLSQHPNLKRIVINGCFSSCDHIPESLRIIKVPTYVHFFGRPDEFECNWTNTNSTLKIRHILEHNLGW